MIEIQRCDDCHEPVGPICICVSCASVRREFFAPASWVEEAFKEAVEMLNPCFTNADTLWHESKALKKLTER
jgi:hypothetical protein